MGSHRHADGRSGKRRCVVDAVTDHDGDGLLPLCLYPAHLVRGGLFGPYLVDSKDGAPICSAGADLSPVSMTNRVIPAARNRRMVRGASGRRGSASRIAPTSWASTSTQATTAASNVARASVAAAHGGGFSGSARLPTMTRLPSTVAKCLCQVPRWRRSAGSAGDSFDCLGNDRLRQHVREYWSAEAARRNTCWRPSGGRHDIGAPWSAARHCPVLSSTSVVARPRFSNAPATSDDHAQT